MSMFLVSENFTSGAGMSYLVLLFSNHHDPFLGEPDIILYVCAFNYSTEQLNIVCHDVDSKAVELALGEMIRVVTRNIINIYWSGLMFNTCR